MSNTTLPAAVKRAASKFKAKRAEYYSYLADMLGASKGETKMLTLFERDAARYEKLPRGILCAYWADKYANNGGDLAATLQGTLPDDEVAILRVAQTAGGGAIEIALGDVGRVARVADRAKAEVRGILMAAVVGLLIACLMITIYPVFASNKLQEIYSFIPLDSWGPQATKFVKHAERVQAQGLYWLAGLCVIFALLQWSINNWVGERRDWADQKLALYSSIRDIKGAMFLATMATLTKRRGNVMFTLRESLIQFAQSLRSPWLRWRVEEIIDRVDASGGTTTDAFDTNLLSKEMFYYLRDVQEARGFSEGFEETGLYVERVVLDTLSKKMNLYKWILLGAGVVVVMAVMAWQYSVIHEMKGTMTNYMNSR